MSSGPGLLLVLVLLGGQEDHPVLGEGLVHRLDRLVPAHVERHDHEGEDHDVPQGQNRQRRRGSAAAPRPCALRSFVPLSLDGDDGFAGPAAHAGGAGSRSGGRCSRVAVARAMSTGMSRGRTRSKRPLARSRHWKETRRSGPARAPLPGHHQVVVPEGDLERLGREPGDLDDHHESAAGLVNVHRRTPVAARQVLRSVEEREAAGRAGSPPGGGGPGQMTGGRRRGGGSRSAPAMAPRGGPGSGRPWPPLPASKLRCRVRIGRLQRRRRRGHGSPRGRRRASPRRTRHLRCSRSR